MKKRMLSLLLAFALLLTYVPLGGTIEVKAGNYNASAAVAYAAEHWDDPPESSGDCARFVSNCLAAGGCTAWSAGVYELKRQLTNGGWGNLYVLTESGSTVYEWQNAGILSAGDPIFYRCLACGDDVWPHVVICGGFDSQGRATAYGHTAPWGAVTYVGDYWDIHNHKGSDIVAYSFHMNASQPSFSFTSIAPGTYYLKHNASGNYMDIRSAEDVDGADIWSYEFNGTVAQQYAFSFASDSTSFILRPHSSGSRIVNAAGYSVLSGAKVCLWENVTDVSQYWRFQKVNGGYTIHNAQNTSCVIEPDSNRYMHVYSYTGSANQIWSIQNSIDYDANGGSGAPSIQMKNYDETAFLSNTIPTREGYNFLGWSTDPSATAPTYYAGGSFTTNANTTLYAVWKEIPIGWVQSGNNWYYYNTSGQAVTGWARVGSKWYYFNSAGAMQTGWLKYGQAWYYLKSSGAMAAGWEKVGNTWYYFNASGKMLTGWIKLGNTWYYLDASGAMQTGWLKAGNVWYYLKSSGAMATGWEKVGNTWYYFDASGKMLTGWQNIGGTYYYFYNSGAMATNCYIGSYWVNASGAWVK